MEAEGAMTDMTGAMVVVGAVAVAGTLGSPKVAHLVGMPTAVVSDVVRPSWCDLHDPKIWLAADMMTTAVVVVVEAGMGTGMIGMTTETGATTVMKIEATIAMMTTVVVRAFLCFTSVLKLMFSHAEVAITPSALMSYTVES